MPSNKVLSNQAQELAKALNITVKTADLNNADLVKLVTDLKAKVKDAENDTRADESESTDGAAGDEDDAETTDEAAGDEDDAESTDEAAGDATDDTGDAEVVEEVKPFPYSVKAGKAVTSKRGILGEGEEVKAEYMPGGQDTIDGLIDRGFVVKG